MDGFALWYQTFDDRDNRLVFGHSVVNQGVHFHLELAELR
jgi:hypothetical protein